MSASKFLDLEGLKKLYGKLKLDFITIKSKEGEKIKREVGSHFAQTLKSLSTEKKSVVAEVNSNQNLSLLGTFVDGDEIHIIVHNIGAQTITVTIPSLGSYVPTNGDALNIKSQTIGEINIMNVKNKYYVRIS